jgi:hypothetical protein
MSGTITQSHPSTSSTPSARTCQTSSAQTRTRSRRPKPPGGTKVKLFRGQWLQPPWKSWIQLPLGNISGPVSGKTFGMAFVSFRSTNYMFINLIKSLLLYTHITPTHTHPPTSTQSAHTHTQTHCTNTCMYVPKVYFAICIMSSKKHRRFRHFSDWVRGDTWNAHVVRPKETLSVAEANHPRDRRPWPQLFGLQIHRYEFGI